MRRGAPMALMVMMTLTAVMAAGCGSNGGGGSGSIRPLGEEVNTEAEYITVSCANEVQACLLPCPADDLYVAINPWDYANSAACGACMEVTGPYGTVTVQVTQNCAGACARDEIELSETAFGMIADTGEGHAPVTWQLVSCDVTGPIAFHFEPESSEWWASIQLRNHRIPVETLEMRWTDGTWRNLPRQAHNYFEARDTPGPGPYTLRVTSVDQQQITEENIPLSPGELVPGTQQFQ